MERWTSGYGADMSAHSPIRLRIQDSNLVGTAKHWHTDEFCVLIDRHIQTAKPKIYNGYT
jgi:hypothetical protein